MNSRRVPVQITPAADVWSLGCVLSECATWIVLGRASLNEYRRRRSKEVEDRWHKNFGDLFHDGEKTLDLIERHHESIKSSLRQNDFITARVVEALIDQMIETDKSERPKAKNIHHRGRKLVERARKDLTSHEQGKSTPSSFEHVQDRGQSSDPVPPDSDSERDDDGHGSGRAEEESQVMLRTVRNVELPQMTVDEFLSQRGKQTSARGPPGNRPLGDLRNRDHVS